MRKQHNTTRLVPGSPEWRRIVTGSKIAPILGISPYTSPSEQWLIMAGQVEPEGSTEAMRRGANQEDSILRWFFTEMRPDIKQVSGETTFTHPFMPWAAGNPDAVAEEDGETVFVEAKSVSRDGGEWGQPGTDQIPRYYWAQVEWCMHMTHHDDGPKVTRTYVIKHGPYVDQYEMYIVDYHPAEIASIAVEAHCFYQSLSDPDGCPDATAVAGIHRVFAKLHPDIEPDFEWEISEDMAVDYLTARAVTKAAQAEESRAKANILRAMGTARTAVCNGYTIAYRRPTRSGVALYPPQRVPTIHDITTNQKAA